MIKKGLAVLLAAIMAFAVSGCAAQEDAAFTVVTSFYPMYVLTRNVTEGIDGVAVVNMAEQSVGCLHDYQLQTRDMVTLEGASALVINGGGMEQFMEKVFSLRSDLPVIDAGDGIEMLESGETDHHDHEHEHGEDEIKNAHVWLNPRLACVQVQNIADGLAAADPANADAYAANAQRYVEKLTALDEEIRAMLAPYAGSEIITFHEAFVYFAEAYDLHVAGLIEHEPGEEPGTREIAQTCDLVNTLGIGALFVEPQYPQRAAETISRETGASIYSLDPVVSGDGGLDDYERAMRENAKTLTEALDQ